MKLGFFATALMRGIDFAEFARFGAEVGYQAMDVPPEMPGTREICDRLGLTVHCTTGLGAAVITKDDAEREVQMARIRAAIDLASAQGIPCIGCSHRRDLTVDAKENVRLFALAFGPLAAYAESKQVKLTFENWPNRGQNLMITPELWDKCFNSVPSKALGLCFDPSHLIWQGIDYLRAARDFGDRIYHAHAKDTEFLPEGQYRYGMYGPQTETPASSGGFWRYRLPGFGVVDWAKYIDTLYQVGYDAVISVEHEDDIWGWRTDVEVAKRGLVLAKQILQPFLA